MQRIQHRKAFGMLGEQGGGQYSNGWSVVNAEEKTQLADDLQAKCLDFISSAMRTNGNSLIVAET